MASHALLWIVLCYCATAMLVASGESCEQINAQHGGEFTICCSTCVCHDYLSSYPEGAVLVGGSFIFISVVSSIIQANYNTKSDDDEGSEDYRMLEGSLLGNEELEREEEDIVNKVEDDDGTMA